MTTNQGGYRARSTQQILVMRATPYIHCATVPGVKKFDFLLLTKIPPFFENFIGWQLQQQKGNNN